MTQTQNDVISVLTVDHRAVESVFHELESGGGSPERRRDLVDHVIAELVQHSVAEEQHLYPTVRKALPDGDEVADHEIAEHAEAEQTMKELEGMDPSDPRFDQLVRQLMDEVRHHVKDEENDLFLRLQGACDPTELQKLGEKTVKAKEWAPTRPHPDAPSRPPMNRILGPGMGLVDRLRDALAGRQT